MSCWSAENAKRAYLQALRMGERGKEPDVAEFLSALAAGKNAKLIVVACAGIAGPTTLALAAAAHQTGGRVVCICCGQNEVQASKKALAGAYGDSVELVVGDVETRLLNEDYKGADFVLVDCDIANAKEILLVALKEAKKKEGALVVGYNVRRRVSCWRQLKTASFLPIGEGLLVVSSNKHGRVEHRKKKSHWIVKVDKYTGEEHIFRVTSPYNKMHIKA
ncbi:DUF1442 family protein [Senna tora]|uniref:DUF1442 family protein n=1 Tax=Senna tora TaxID=362788 RepID=A0A834XGE1_9FABA|nr:DUF1442 family protein [Senna tora]